MCYYGHSQLKYFCAKVNKDVTFVYLKTNIVSGVLEFPHILKTWKHWLRNSTRILVLDISVTNNKEL